MCAKTDLKDTLLRILKSKTLLENMEFPTVEQQQNLFHQLQEKRPNFYKDLDPKKRTIFIRQTGDNYRSFRMPTQQMSFSVLNLTKLINSQSGQTVECMWRGQEDRQHILGHCTSTFETLDKFAQSGIVATLHDGSLETFNVVVLYVADLCHMQYVLGRVNTTATYGCWHCKKNSNSWADKKCQPAGRLTMDQMKEFGEKAVKQLGQNPREDQPAFKKFHVQHFGQIAPPLLSCLTHETMPVCSLHLILAVHRLFWKIIHSVAKARNQEELIVPALKKIGCHYLAFQMKSYFNCKGKHYDGSSTMRMTGNDCKRLEANVEAFVSTFLVSTGGETIRDQSATRLYLLQKAVQSFRDIAHDLRSAKATQKRVDSFSDRVEKWFLFCKAQFPSECTQRMPYVHILREHVGPLLKFWFAALGWGYGMFSCSASEHLNKRLKVFECDHTSRKTSRFYSIIHSLRVLSFYYPNSLFTASNSSVKCSACGEKGHNKKNRLCPNHPTRILDFSDSEEEI